MSSSKKKFSIASILGVGGMHPWKTHSFELLKKSVEAAVRKVPQKMDFYILHAISFEPLVSTTKTTTTSSPLPTPTTTGGSSASSSSSPNSNNSLKGNNNQFPSSPSRAQPQPQPHHLHCHPYSNPHPQTHIQSPVHPSLTTETLLNDIIWLGKTLSNLLTLAEMQKPSGHESDHTKRTAFEGFMGLVAHLNGVVQRLYANYMDSSGTIIDYVKAKKMVGENLEYETIARAFEIGELARKSSTKMTASSFYLILSQLLRGLTENPKICEWLFCDDFPPSSSSLSYSSSASTSSYLCGGGGGSGGGGTVYY